MILLDWQAVSSTHSALYYSTNTFILVCGQLDFTATYEHITEPKNIVHQTELHITFSTCGQLFYSPLAFSQKEK